MSKASIKAIVPKEWEVTIKAYAINADDKVALYEFIIDYQTETPQPDVKDLPPHLQITAGGYIPQMDRMRKTYEEKVNRLKLNTTPKSE